MARKAFAALWIAWSVTATFMLPWWMWPFCWYTAMRAGGDLADEFWLAR